MILNLLLDPRVVDQDAERPELPDRLVEQAAGVFGPGVFGPDQDAAGSSRLDRRERLPRRTVSWPFFWEGARNLCLSCGCREDTDTLLGPTATTFGRASGTSHG
jgi:hypothetical protein